MKLLEAKETLTRHINDLSWLNERNLDVLEVKKILSELDKLDNDTVLSIEQISKLIEVLTKKEIFQIFLDVKDYLQTENLLNSDNLIGAIDTIEIELLSMRMFSIFKVSMLLLKL